MEKRFSTLRPGLEAKVVPELQIHGYFICKAIHEISHEFHGYTIDSNGMKSKVFTTWNSMKMLWFCFIDFSLVVV